jgi:hypothetical protein
LFVGLILGKNIKKFANNLKTRQKEQELFQADFSAVAQAVYLKKIKSKEHVEKM